MITKLLVGTGNPSKPKDYEKYFADLPIKVVSAADLGIIEEPEETGKTIEDNAILKAKYYFEKSGGLPTLADDAGFEIPALDNFPGVNSKRFTGHEMKDEEIIYGILEAMKNLKGDDRQARMRMCCALMLAPNEIHLAPSVLEGHVPEAAYERRIPHFPYRSLLFVDQVNKWWIDLTREEDEKLGHRGRVIAELKQYLI